MKAQGTAAKPVPEPPQPPRAPRDRRTLVIRYSAAAALLVVATAVGYWLWPQPTPAVVPPLPGPPAVQLTEYGQLWKTAWEAVAGFGSASLQAASAGQPWTAQCEAQARALAAAVTKLQAMQPPTEDLAFHWRTLPLLQELQVAEELICVGLATNDPNKQAQGWSWVASIQSVLPAAIPELSKS